MAHEDRERGGAPVPVTGGKAPWFPRVVNSGWAILAFVVGFVLGAILV